MDPSGGPDPAAGVEPSAAFFGLWPKFADAREPVPGVTPLTPRPAPVVHELRRLRSA
ncbi:MAG: hypothetical protein JO306_10165 [Gemmatimonadetes bacterium]|nr:hypothetical protein [Gemmatimonadota bacterium]